MSDWWTNTFGGDYKLKENEVKLSNETEEYAFEIELCIHGETELFQINKNKKSQITEFQLMKKIALTQLYT